MNGEIGMSEEINKEILKELQKLNEKVDRLENPTYVPPMKFILNCILIFFTVLAATTLLYLIPMFF